MGARGSWAGSDRGGPHAVPDNGKKALAGALGVTVDRLGKE
jgi:hypothetical protein